MGFFDFLFGEDINQGVEDWKKTEDGILLDVRSREEYSQGHIPGSVNIPLPELPSVSGRIPDKEKPLFVHCLSGSRSGQAVSWLKRSGYTRARNIGGISGYRGRKET